MKKKSIYIMYTGGTIGMKFSNNGYIPISGYLQNQLKFMPKFYQSEMPNFTISEYIPLIDSSNMTPVNWQYIANDIKKNYHNYDGFIVLHGTDTMAFTASALSFILENLSKPVIITGSQIPLSELRSDGYTNLLHSIYLSANYPINEVCIFFNNKLFRGNRTSKEHANSFNAFSSPNFPPLIEVDINIRYINKIINPFYNKKLHVHIIKTQPIGIVTIYPGISVKIIHNFLLKPIKALILRSYGIGNAPQKIELINELQNAFQRDIIIINLTQCISGTVNMKKYATGNTLKHSGVISGFDMTIEATLTKLHFLLSKTLTSKQIRFLMQKNLRGELSINNEN